MERARATWTDERLDDLSHRMDDGFNRVDEDLRSLRVDLGARIDAQGAELGARIDAQGAELGARIDAQGTDLGSRIGRLEGRLDALQRTMIQVGGVMGVGIFGTLITVLATRG